MSKLFVKSDSCPDPTSFLARMAIETGERFSGEIGVDESKPYFEISINNTSSYNKLRHHCEKKAICMRRLMTRFIARFKGLNILFPDK